MRNPPALVSVVVPVRDAERTLADQLDAIAAQDHDGDVEIVVALNGGGDRTANVADHWARCTGRGRVVDASARRGPGYARNAGAAAARGELLAFCDADDVVSAGWLRALVRAARDADVVTGPHATDRLNGPALRSCQSMPPADRRFHAFLPAASGSNCGVWRDVFDALGGFDVDSLAGEDVSFSWRAQLEGFRLAVAQDAVVHKRFRRSRLGIAPQYFRYGIGDAWLYSRFRAAGMPRRSVGEALEEWRQLARGLPAHAGKPGRFGRTLKGSALACGRITGSLRHRALFL